MVSKIKWLYVSCLGLASWLPEAHLRRLASARRALAKHEHSVVKKSAPLYGWMLLAVFRARLFRGDAEAVIFALWVTAYSLVCRLGELLHPRRAFQDVQLVSSIPAFAVHHVRGAPKANKVREAPYGLISFSGNPFGFAVLQAHLERFHSDAARSAVLFPALPSRRVPVSVKSAVSVLRRWLRELGVPDPDAYTGHAARRGAYNDIRSSVPVSLIAAQGHWSPDASTASQEYALHTTRERSLYF